MRANTLMPYTRACSKVPATVTPPNRMAGSDSTGSENRTAVDSSVVAVRPEMTRSGGAPLAVNIW